MEEQGVSGVMVGLVTDLEDPEGLNRVRVSYPVLAEQEYWAHLATPMAGADRGIVLNPEVGDQVLVSFLQGDIRYPYILGCVWNGGQRRWPPPYRLRRLGRCRLTDGGSTGAAGRVCTSRNASTASLWRRTIVVPS